MSNNGSSQRRLTNTRQGPGREEKNTTVVSTEPETITSTDTPCRNLLDLLFSDSDPEVKVIRASDEGSKSQCTLVQIQNVPAYGIIDTAVDIIIIGGGFSKGLLP